MNSTNGVKKERLLGFDFVRAVCAIGIVVYHFYCATASGFKPISSFGDGATFGTVFVTCFFMISGAMMYYNYSELKPSDVPRFYKKRWLRLFPMFLLAWAFFYLQRVFETRVPFWAGSPWKILLSLTGMDGYLNYLTAPNYYIIGEWFLGALVLLYLLFPLINLCVRKSAYATLAVNLILFLVIVKTDFFQIADS